MLVMTEIAAAAARTNTARHSKSTSNDLVTACLPRRESDSGWFEGFGALWCLRQHTGKALLSTFEEMASPPAHHARYSANVIVRCLRRCASLQSRIARASGDTDIASLPSNQLQKLARKAAGFESRGVVGAVSDQDARRSRIATTCRTRRQ